MELENRIPIYFNPRESTLPIDSSKPHCRRFSTRSVEMWWRLQTRNLSADLNRNYCSLALLGLSIRISRIEACISSAVPSCNLFCIQKAIWGWSIDFKCNWEFLGWRTLLTWILHLLSDWSGYFCWDKEHCAVQFKRPSVSHVEALIVLSVFRGRNLRSCREKRPRTHVFNKGVSFLSQHFLAWPFGFFTLLSCSQK